MYWSRSLDELHPRVAKKARALIEKCHEEDIELVVVCTYRDLECGKELHKLGREKPGRELSHMYPTQCFHQYRVAFDVCVVLWGVPIPFPKTANEKRIWSRVKEIGMSLGLEWGIKSAARVEWGHFQLTEGLTIEQFRAGKTL